MADSGFFTTTVPKTFFGSPTFTAPRSINSGRSSDRPDDSLLAEFDRLHRTVYNSYIAAVQEDNRYYKGKYGKDAVPASWRARGFKETVPGTAYDAVETATNHILTVPAITVPARPVDSGWAEEDAIAERKKAMLDFFWANVALKGDPLRRAVKKTIKDGRMVLKKEIDWNKVDLNGISTGRKGFPWTVKVLPSESVYEDPDHPDDPEYVFETYTVRVASAKRMFPHAAGAWTNDNADANVRLIEYWSRPYGTSKGRRVVWIESEQVLAKANPYHWECGYTDGGTPRYDGYIPYFSASSGWGDESEDMLPEDRYVGILRHMRDTLEAEVEQLSAAKAQLRISTFPITLLHGITEDDEKPIKIEPGVKIPLTGEQDIKLLAWPDVPGGVWEIMNRYTRYNNNLSKADALGGQAQRGVDTATEAQQNFGNASASLNGPVGALKSVVVRINATILQDVEMVLESDMTVYGASDGGTGVVTVSPEDIDGFYDTFVELKTSDEAALDNANTMLWANLGQVMRLDRGYVMKMAGIKFPSERIARRAEEDTFDDPRQHELRVAMSMAGQGTIGAEMAAIIAGNAANVGPGEQKGGSFAGGGGAPASENASPATAPTGEGLRASAFGQALDQRPDQAYG